MTGYGPIHDIVYRLFPDPILIHVTVMYPVWTVIIVASIGHLRDWLRAS